MEIVGITLSRIVAMKGKKQLGQQLDGGQIQTTNSLPKNKTVTEAEFIGANGYLSQSFLEGGLQLKWHEERELSTRKKNMHERSSEGMLGSFSSFLISRKRQIDLRFDSCSLSLCSLPPFLLLSCMYCIFHLRRLSSLEQKELLIRRNNHSQPLTIALSCFHTVNI